MDLVTRLDQAAVHGAGRDWRDFVVDRAQHGFVEQAQAARGVGLIDARAPFEGQRHCDEIGFAEASTDLRRTFGQAAGVREVTADDALEGDRQQHVAVLRALLRQVVQEPVGAAQPATCLGEVALVIEMEEQPVGGSHGPSRLAAVDVALIGAPQRVEALLHLSEQKCRGRQELEVVRVQRSLAIGERQSGVRRLPIETLCGRATAHELTLDSAACSASTSRYCLPECWSGPERPAESL